MSSNNYSIEFDSLNSGGLDESSSTNFELLDTVGEFATGESDSENFGIRAGYRQLQEGYISITAEPDESIPSVGGLTGGTGFSESTWTVMTDNPAGYELYVRAASSPAMTSGAYYFDDYVPSGPVPDYNFTVSATSSVFGFSPEGADILQTYKDNGSACNAGSLDTLNKCWDGFSTTDKVVSRSYSANHPVGEQTTIKYAAGVGTSRLQENGSYSANIIVTATAL